jgi:hypothetical protein
MHAPILRASQRMSVAMPIVTVEAALQVPMIAKRMLALLRMSKHSPRVMLQCTHRSLRCDMPAARRLMSNRFNGPACNAWHRLQQVASMRLAMQLARNLSDVVRETRRSFSYCSRHFRQQLLCRRSNGPGHNRKQLACGHSDQWQEMLSRFIFGFSLSGKLTQVLHHGIGIDLAHRADLVLKLIFEFELIFFLALTKQATCDIAESAEPAFTFKACLVLQFIFQLVFQFVLKLVRHDDSSCKIWLNCKGPV